MKTGNPSLKEEATRLAQQAETDLMELLSQRAELDEKIIRLRQFLKGLQPILGADYKSKLGQRSTKSSVEEESGLKETCLEILQTAYEPLTATQIVNELRERGFSIDKYSNPLAVVSTTLKRLVKNKEAYKKDIDGKTAYIVGHGKQNPFFDGGDNS
jgi:hypothetical protein